MFHQEMNKSIFRRLGDHARLGKLLSFPAHRIFYFLAYFLLRHGILLGISQREKTQSRVNLYLPSVSLLVRRSISFVQSFIMLIMDIP
jgi:hypothetical protein